MLLSHAALMRSWSFRELAQKFSLHTTFTDLLYLTNLL